ncbi:hypothetical protein SOASR032_24110 [Pragia fontium]|uniref:Uncharacterized protein n=1 Tax=Pragia fontium TaxID=82985 RepID=A0ABQ5LJP5_9GAMM|nr:hypothetical protein SOASR032_24110 [Pragia fontium]
MRNIDYSFIEALRMRLTIWSAHILMRCTIYGYHLRLLSSKQAIHNVAYSTHLVRQALIQLKLRREKRKLKGKRTSQ